MLLFYVERLNPSDAAEEVVIDTTKTQAPAPSEAPPENPNRIDPELWPPKASTELHNNSNTRNNRNDSNSMIVMIVIIVVVVMIAILVIIVIAVLIVVIIIIVCDDGKNMR